MTEGTSELCGILPGGLGRITQLHGEYYHRHWGFDLGFECQVARELGEFLLRFDSARDGFWLARVDGVIAGSIAIDGILAEGEGARLRWFILDAQAHGLGLGKRLMAAALQFCHEAGHRRVWLWTFAGLDAARHLYEASGFTLWKEMEDDQWGKTVTGQMFELHL